MKNILVIAGILGVLVLAFFISKKNIPAQEQATTPETNTINTPEEVVTEINEINKPAVIEKTIIDNKKYSYTNPEFKFAVDLQGLITTRKADIPTYIAAVFTFGVGDQSNIEEEKRIPNSMALYIWNDNNEFNLMMAGAIKLPSEKINGTNFDVYSFSNEGETIHHYAVEIDNKIYDIGVRNKQDINKFYMLK